MVATEAVVPRRAHADAIGALAIGVSASVLLFVRIPEAARNFWTDDGAFFSDAHTRGVLPPFTHFYKGYLQTLDRAMAAVSAALPIRSAPAVLFVLTAIVIGWCAATAFLVSRPWIVSTAGRVAIAISVVALPSFGRANIGSAAFLQFTMLFVALLVLLHPADSKAIDANSCIFLVTVGLSSLLSVTLLPALIWRVVRSRRFTTDAVALSFVGATAVQVIAVVLGRPTRPPTHVSKSLRAVASGYVHNVISDNFAPNSATLRPALVLGAIVVGLIVVAALLVALANNVLATAALLIGVPLLGLSVYTIAGVSQGVVERYTVFPALCLVWAVVAATDFLVARSHGAVASARSAMVIVVVAVVLASWASGWRPAPVRVTGARWTASLDSGRARCTRQAPDSDVSLAIMPPGWFVHLHCSAIAEKQSAAPKGG